MTEEKIMKALGYVKAEFLDINEALKRPITTKISLSEYRECRKQYNNDNPPDLKVHILESQLNILKMIQMYKPNFNNDQIDVFKYCIDLLNKYIK